jgi:hypothetical protein
MNVKAIHGDTSRLVDTPVENRALPNPARLLNFGPLLCTLSSRCQDQQQHQHDCLPSGYSRFLGRWTNVARRPGLQMSVIDHYIPSTWLRAAPSTGSVHINGLCCDLMLLDAVDKECLSCGLSPMV